MGDGRACPFRLADAVYVPAARVRRHRDQPSGGDVEAPRVAGRILADDGAVGERTAVVEQRAASLAPFPDAHLR